MNIGSTADMLALPDIVSRKTTTPTDVVNTIQAVSSGRDGVYSSLGESSSASLSPPRRRSRFEHGHHRLPYLPTPSVLFLLPHPSLWLHPTLGKWRSLAQRNDDDSIARQPLVTSAKRARSNATVRCLVRTASARTRATLARSQVRRLGERRALRILQRIATAMPTTRNHKLWREDTRIPSLLCAPRRTLITLDLRFRLL
jgi:hypothetical protein